MFSTNSLKQLSWSKVLEIQWHVIFLEQATGAFQIRPIRLLDYNQRTGDSYKIEDCYNYDISKKIFLYYAMQIGFPKYETIARSWNGSGSTTLEYWEKVKSYL